MSRTSTLHAAAAALGVLAGFALAPDGAAPLGRDVTPHAVAVAWNAPEPPAQVLRIRYLDDAAASAAMPAVHWSPAPAAHPESRPRAYPLEDTGGGAASAERPEPAGAAGETGAADEVLPAGPRDCPGRFRRASARLRQS